MTDGIVLSRDKQIEKTNIKFLKTGLNINGQLSFADWESLGNELGYIEGSVHWWIGDWLNYGEKNYGETYAQAMDATNYDYSTVKNDKWVSGEIELSRRRDNLTWSHHCEIAQLETTKEQDLFLDKCGSEDWSRAKLREEIKKHKLQKKVERLLAESVNDSRWNVYNADVCTWQTDKKYHFIVTDPPYPKEYLHLYGILASRAREWLKPDGLVIAMCGQSYLDEIYKLMGEYLVYYWTGCYYTPGQAPNLRQKQVNSNWKPLLIYGLSSDYKGKTFSDVFKSEENDKDYHEWGQSVSGMYSIISQICLPGQLILDPFCGAGTTGIAALKHGCLFDGLDIDEQKVNISRGRLYDSIKAG